MNGPNPSISPEVEFSQFAACDLRVGTILSASPLEMAKTPAYVIELDFGEWGSLKSTAQLTLDHTPEQLVGRQVVAVVNLPPKQVGKHTSRCLILGAVHSGHVGLLSVPPSVPNGTRIH